MAKQAAYAGDVDASSVPGGPQSPGDEYRGVSWGVRARRAVAFQNISAIYIFVVMFVIFSLWVPDTFLTSGTWRSLISNEAITCLVAIAVVLPLSAGVFDLAVGTEVGLGAILVAWLLNSQHASVPVAIVVTLVGGAMVGVVIWMLIVRVRISSFIATLGVSSVLLGVIAWISNSQQILGLGSGFGNLATSELFGLAAPVYIMLAVAVIVWHVLERTPAGRRIYATGADIDASALAGIRTSRVILFSTVSCGVIAALAGLLESSQLSTGDPTIGPPYLLPAFAAVSLGSTQFRGGRINVWGTVLAAYVLAVGVTGLQLAGAPVWIPNLFNGVALLLAVGMAQFQRRPGARFAAIRRLIRRGNG